MNPSDQYIQGGSPAIYVAYQFGRFVCVADSREYRIIDLKDKKMVPVAVYNDRSQERMNNPVTSVRPLITTVADREFLVVLPTDDNHILCLWKSQWLKPNTISNAVTS